jgi:hypothetical protein
MARSSSRIAYVANPPGLGLAEVARRNMSLIASMTIYHWEAKANATYPLEGAQQFYHQFSNE